MPKYFLIFIFSLFSLPGFCQEGGRVIIRETTPSQITSHENAADVSEMDDEAMVEELEAVKKKQTEQIQDIQKTVEIMESPLGNPLEELQKLGHEQLNAAALLDDKVLAALQKMYKEGGMSDQPRESVKQMIQERIKGSVLEKVVARFPNLLEIFVDVLRDKDAFPSLINILRRKDDLKTYGYIWLVIFVFGIWIKGKIINPKWTFFRRLKYSLSFSFVLTGASVYFFYSLFQSELKPTLSIVAKYF